MKRSSSFLDGNGRLGRLLITFLFCAEGALHEPLLYLSLYFKQHRQQYYDLLQSVSFKRAILNSGCYFLSPAVEETANQAAQTARALMDTRPPLTKSVFKPLASLPVLLTARPSVVTGTTDHFHCQREQRINTDHTNSHPASLRRLEKLGIQYTKQPTIITGGSMPTPSI